MQLNIYLFFNGNCEEAMNFYKDALNGNVEMISRYGEAPMPCPDADKNKVMHGVLNAAETKIFFSDCPGDRPATYGDNYSVSLNMRSAEELTGAFNALSAGGIVTMPLQDTFWGATFGMCKDKFGVNWMFNFDKPKTSGN